MWSRAFILGLFFVLLKGLIGAFSFTVPVLSTKERLLLEAHLPRVDKKEILATLGKVVGKSGTYYGVHPY